MGELLRALWDVLRALRLEFKRRPAASYRPPSTSLMNAMMAGKNEAQLSKIAQEIKDQLPKILDLEFQVVARLAQVESPFSYQFQVLVTTAHVQTGKSKSVWLSFVIEQDDFIGGDIPRTFIDEVAGTASIQFNSPEKILRYYAELSADE